VPAQLAPAQWTADEQQAHECRQEDQGVGPLEDDAPGGGENRRRQRDAADGLVLVSPQFDETGVVEAFTSPASN
jgi:hypothetical protein